MAVRAGRLHNGVFLTSSRECIAHLIGGSARRLVDRDGRAAHKFGTEVQTAHAANHQRHSNAACRNDKQHLASAQERNITLDKAADNLLSRRLRFVFHQLLRATNGVQAVMDVPEIGVLRNGARRHQANERCLEDEHHNDVAENTQRQRHAEALDRRAGQEEQRQRGHKRYQVGVDGRQNSVAHTALRSGFDGAAHADFLAEALQGQNGRVSRHTNGQHDTGNACQRKAELAQQRQQAQNAQVQNREDEHCRSSDNAKALIEEEQIDYNQQKADQRNQNAGGQRVLAQGGADYLALRIRETYGQRTALQNRLQRFCLVKRVVTGNGNLATRDFRLHRRSTLHHAIKQNDNLAMGGNKLFCGLRKCCTTRRIKRQVHRIRGCRFGFAAHIHAADILAGDKRCVRALRRGELRLNGELLARYGVGNVLVVGLTAVDFLLYIFIGEAVQACELQLTRGADGLQRLLRVGNTRNLNKNLIVALHLNGCLGCAQQVHALFNNRTAFLHVFAGNRRSVLI